MSPFVVVNVSKNITARRAGGGGAGRGLAPFFSSLLYLKNIHSIDVQACGDGSRRKTTASLQHNSSLLVPSLSSPFCRWFKPTNVTQPGGMRGVRGRDIFTPMVHSSTLLHSYHSTNIYSSIHTLCQNSHHSIPVHANTTPVSSAAVVTHRGNTLPLFRLRDDDTPHPHPPPPPPSLNPSPKKLSFPSCGQSHHAPSSMLLLLSATRDGCEYAPLPLLVRHVEARPPPPAPVRGAC